MKITRAHAALASIALAVSAASAQTPRPDAGNYDHPAREYGTQGFLFFQAVGDGVGNAEALLNTIQWATKVDRQTATRFSEYTSKSLADLMDFRRQSRQSLICSRQSEMRAAPQFAAAVDSLNVAIETRRAQLVRGSEAILGAEGMRNFELYLSNKDRNVQEGKNPSIEERQAQYSAMPPEQLQSLLTKLCNLK